jgi:acetyl esterase/lipase
MKKTVFYLLLLILSFHGKGTFAQDPNFHIYLCIGQSNMEGAGRIEAQDTIGIDSRFKILEALDCPELNRVQGKWHTAKPPLCRCKTGLSPADYFGRTMLENMPREQSLGLVHVAVAGSKIEIFDKVKYQAYLDSSAKDKSWMINMAKQYGGNPYERLVEMARIAQKSGVIKGILLHQGESNTGDETWPAQVKKLYDDILADLNLTPNSIPLLAGELVGADQGGKCASMNEIINTLPQTLPKAMVVSSKGLPAVPDKLHFNSAGVRIFGKRYAAALLASQGKKINIDESSILASEKMLLYPEGVPNSKPSDIKETGADNGVYKGITNPTLEYYKADPSLSTGAAVVVIPGGGYGVVVYNGEGINIAKALAEKGIAAFILKYRLPSDAIMPDKKVGPLQDAQQALKIVRENAEKWGIDKNKIGIMGFSAGGHLASTAATHFEKVWVNNPNNTSVRPDFQILVYPVISMRDSLAHKGSRENLLGKNPSKEDMIYFSNELQIKANTPPTWLTHAADDKVVDVDNSIAYFESLRKNKVEVEMHIFPKGDHGFIFKHPGWMNPLFDWLKRNAWIK